MGEKLTFTGSSAVVRAKGCIAEDTPDGKVREASKHETEEGTVEDEEEDEVVALLEADGVVDLAGYTDKAVCWWTFRSAHCETNKKMEETRTVISSNWESTSSRRKNEKLTARESTRAPM